MMPVWVMCSAGCGIIFWKSIEMLNDLSGFCINFILKRTLSRGEAFGCLAFCVKPALELHLAERR